MRPNLDCLNLNSYFQSLQSHSQVVTPVKLQLSSHLSLQSLDLGEIRDFVQGVGRLSRERRGWMLTEPELRTPSVVSKGKESSEIVKIAKLLQKIL